MKKRLYPHLKLVIIPSWGKLLGYPSLGTYKNKQILKITQDPLFLFSNLEGTIQKDGKFNHYMFGLGYYYTKFQIDENKYIIDYRIVSGIAIADFLYQTILDSDNVSLVKDEKIILKENLFSIPLNLHNLSQKEKNFVQGILNRHIFIPYKEIFSKFIDIIKNTNNQILPPQFQSVLYATPDRFNQMYISERLKPAHQQEIKDSTAGINHIFLGAEYTLAKSFSDQQLTYIDERIKSVYNTLQEIEYNSTTPYEFLQKCGKELITEFQPISLPNTPEFLKKIDLNPGILVTAPKFHNSIPWDSNIPKNKPESWGIYPNQNGIRPPALTDKIHSNQDVLFNQDLGNYTPGPQEHQEIFELERFKHPKVEPQPLDPMPTKDIIEILEYLQEMIKNNYEKYVIGEVFGIARDQIRKISLHTPFIWEMSKISNKFSKGEPGFGLNRNEKERTLESLHQWITPLKQEKLRKQKELAMKQARIRKQIEEEHQRKIQEQQQIRFHQAQEMQRETEIREKFKQKVQNQQKRVEISDQISEAPVSSSKLESKANNLLLEQKTKKLGEMTKTLITLKTEKPNLFKGRWKWWKKVREMKKRIKQIENEIAQMIKQ